MKTKVLLLLCITVFVIHSMPGQSWENDSSQWVELTPEDGFVLDLRYATPNNFVNHTIYECGRCFLRPDVANQLKEVNRKLLEKGYRIKLFDCYRPLAVQWELWEEVSDPRYVADPREGSMHNRGMAVDLTLVNENGEELDMGTDFDYFGKKAYHSHTPQLSDTIQSNRNLLKTSMESAGFKPITTEWWHYNYQDEKFWPVFESKWKCRP